MIQPHPALFQLQYLHDQLVGLSPLEATDRALMLRLMSETLARLASLGALDMPPAWLRQVHASEELVSLAQTEARRSKPAWAYVLAALNAALYPWAHLATMPMLQKR